LVQILFSIRSERRSEQLEYNLLFRWFVGLSIDEPVWVPTVFTKNRDRLLMSKKLMASILPAYEAAATQFANWRVAGTAITAPPVVGSPYSFRTFGDLTQQVARPLRHGPVNTRLRCLCIRCEP
jgi:transposase-like protein DUF772